MVNEVDTVPYASIRPTHSLDLLSHREIKTLMASNEKLYSLFSNCALAILNADSKHDDSSWLTKTFTNFEIKIVQQSRGLRLDVYNAPGGAFVDGKMIQGIADNLFSALRDLVYTHHKLTHEFDLSSMAGISDAVFRILRNAGTVQANIIPNLVVCWGGHSIDHLEYDFCKKVGCELGLRGLDIATGCGIGAMKGPMKGAVVGHGKQKLSEGRYIGITEPGIIASESPNPTVNHLVILPDIEKRLEAFVRLAHGIIVFPGGAGTAEEVMYLLGLLMHPDNQSIPLPVVFSAPAEKADYFQQLDEFLVETLGEDVRKHYRIVIGDPAETARYMRREIEKVKRYRRKTDESYAFNWQLKIPENLQQPFIPTHEAMSRLRLSAKLPVHELIGQLRSAFSGIVAGNVKAESIAAIEQHGPYQLKGERRLMKKLEGLLQAYASQGRMKLEGEYKACYELHLLD